MRRSYKILIIALVPVVLIAATLIVAIRFLPESDLIRQNVQAKLGELTGQEVVLGSLKVTTSFPRLVHLTFEGVAVNSPRGKRILSADTIVLSPALMPLFKRQVSVESITVQGLRMSLDQIRDGLEKQSPAPSSQLQAPKPAQRMEGPDATPAAGAESPKPQELAEERSSTFQWSLDKIKLADTRIDWTHKQIVPGREVVVSLDGVEGVLTRQDEPNSFAVKVTALISVDKANSGAIKLGGILTTTSDLSRLTAAQLDLSADSLEVKPFHPLLPSSAPMFREFASATISGRLVWGEAQRPNASYKIELKAPEKGPAQLGIQGEVVPADDFSSIEAIRGTLETSSLPLSFIKAHLPEQAPIDTSQGFVKASLQGEWSAGRDWAVRGAVGVENAVPTGKIKRIGKHLRLWAHIRANPEQLLLENMEVFGATRVASVSGKVNKPFSKSPSIDLKGQLSVEPHWLKGFGIQLPKALEIGGTIPVRGLVRGEADQLWTDLTADLIGTEIKWAPHFQKRTGKKATLSFKGKFSPTDDSKSQQQKTAGLMNLSMAGTSLRLSSQASWISEVAVQLNSKVLSNGGTVDFKDAALALRRGSEANDLLTARASVSGLGSASPRIDANGTVTLDKRLLELAGMEVPRTFTMSGSAPLKISLSGSTPNFDWNAELPLTHLDITHEKAFRKPGGMNGSVSASGKFVGDELLLNNGRLTLPGLHVTANGLLRDKSGNFRGATLNIKKTELKEIARLVPAAAAMGLSGPVEAAIILKPVPSGVVPAGTVGLFNVDYRPDKAGWALEKMKGTLKVDGAAVEVPELTGHLRGALEGPVKLKGTLNGVTSLETLGGRVSANIGKGRIKADRLRSLLNQAQLLVGTLINPQSPDKADDPLEFQSLTGDFQITSGTARTENLALKGKDLGSGVIGSLRLPSMELDALVGIHTVTVVGDAIGRIPAVKQLVKKHEGLLSVTGLDKELKKLGIDITDSKEKKPGQPAEPVKTPVTVILRLKGPAASPNVVPVLENALEKTTLARLKSLMN